LPLAYNDTIYGQRHLKAPHNFSSTEVFEDCRSTAVNQIHQISSGTLREQLLK
jgi:hypothetical protein